MSHAVVARFPSDNNVQCTMLSTSGFVDDVIFSFNRRSRTESKTSRVFCRVRHVAAPGAKSPVSHCILFLRPIALQITIKFNRHFCALCLNFFEALSHPLSLAKFTATFCVQNALFRVQITQLKIASNPFAKGFRDSEADERER